MDYKTIESIDNNTTCKMEKNRKKMPETVDDNQNKKKPTGRPRKEICAKGTDILTCKICGKQYKRYNSSSHKKTKYHQAYEKLLEDYRISVLATIPEM